MQFIHHTVVSFFSFFLFFLSLVTFFLFREVCFQTNITVKILPLNILFPFTKLNKIQNQVGYCGELLKGKVDMYEGVKRKIKGLSVSFDVKYEKLSPRRLTIENQGNIAESAFPIILPERTNRSSLYFLKSI